MISKNKKVILTVLVFLIAAFASIAPVYAQGGEYSSSPGVPGQKPISLISVTLEDGSKIDSPEGIALEPRFTLTFDKNVVNMLNWENNVKCFSLLSESDESVALSVAKIDDTVDFSQRQKIFVQPVSRLKADTSYYLKISPDLKAKNGVTLGISHPEGILITFRTEKLPLPQNSTANTVNTVNTVEKQQKSYVAASHNESTKKANNTLTQKRPSVSVSTADNKAGAEDKSNAEKVVVSSKKIAPTEKSLNSGINGVKLYEKPTVKVNNEFINFLIKNWLAAAAVLLIVCWLSVEIIVKRKKSLR